MRKVFLIAILVFGVIGLSACNHKDNKEKKVISVDTKLTKSEVKLANDIHIYFNEYIGNPRDIQLIVKAINAKQEFINKTKYKANTNAVKKTLKVYSVLPLWKSFCVTALINKNAISIAKCVDNLNAMDKEPDNKYANTSKKVIYDHLVIYYGNKHNFLKSEKLAYRTLKLYPNDADTYANLAMLYAKADPRHNFKDAKEKGCYAFFLEQKAADFGNFKAQKFLRTYDAKDECINFNGNKIFNKISNKVLGE